MAAGSGGRFEASDIRACLAADRLHAWGAVDSDGTLIGMVATEIIDYPRKRAMRLVGISAHSPWRWLRLFHELEQIARDEFGCHLMEALHQPGHDRLLTTGGWAVWHHLSMKAL